MKIPLLQRNSNKVLLDKACNRLSEIRNQSDYLAICAQPTGYSWLGVNIATKSLFPDCTFEMPQYFSNPIYTPKEISKLCSVINELRFNQVIFSGFAPFYEQICNELNTFKKVIYHGFLAELSDNILQQKIFNLIVTLAKEKKIKSVGFIKKGLALSINKIYNIPTFEIILPNNNINENKKVLELPLRIGCLVNTSFRKNIHNQSLAASMVKDATVHVFKTKELDYIDNGQLVFHDLMDHSQFLELLSSMTINLHVTFSESWGQVLSESISQGVPCISGYTSSFFDYDEELKQKLIVHGYDDSWCIYKKIEEVLNEHDYLSKKCIDYSILLNNLADDRIKKFLNA